MLDAAVIVLRFVQYGAAAVLMGSPLFLLYALPQSRNADGSSLYWAKPLLVGAAVVLLLGTVAGLLVQTAVMAGSFAEGLKPESLSAVLSGMNLGKSAIVRAPITLFALVLLVFVRPRRGLWLVVAILGALAAASFSWMGHGAATDGPGREVHLFADILHSWAAAVWVGALVSFILLLYSSVRDPLRLRALHAALHRFSTVGTLLVAVLVVTGLTNSWFLVGTDHVAGLWTTDYGRLLLLKLSLFAAMLGLAAANRFRHTPALGASIGTGIDTVSVAALRRSLVLEAFFGFAVLALVAWFGMLEPPVSYSA